MKTLLAILTSLILFSTSTFAKDSKGGNHGGGGGTSIAAEFETIAAAILANSGKGPTGWNVFEVPNSESSNTEEVEKLIRSIKVEVSKKPLYVGRRAVEAKNFPDTRVVQIYDVAWKQIKSMDKKVLLVIHEILGLLRIPDPRYIESTRIFKHLKVNLDGDFKNFSRVLTLAPTSIVKAVTCMVMDQRPISERKPDFDFALEFDKDFGWNKELEIAPQLTAKVNLKPSTSTQAWIHLMKHVSESEGVKTAGSMSTSLYGEARKFELEAADFRIICFVK